MAALIALQVGVGGVALATVEDAADTAAGGSGTTTTIAGAATLPDGTPAPGAPGAPPEGAAPGQPGGAPAPGGAVAPPAASADLNALPERPAPPRPGTYRFKSKSDGRASFGTYTTEFRGDEETETRYESVAPGPGGEVRDREAAEQSGSGGGFNFSGSGARERSWRADGMFVTAESGGSSAGGDEGSENFQAACDWQPDLIVLAFPLKEGTNWKWNTSCESKSENLDMKQRYSGSARVTGTRTASVGGREIKVIVIERQSVRDVETTFRREGQEYQGDTHVEETATLLFASSVALPVRTESKFKGTQSSAQAPGQQGKFEGTSITELLSLDPK